MTKQILLVLAIAFSTACGGDPSGGPTTTSDTGVPTDTADGGCTDPLDALGAFPTLVCHDSAWYFPCATTADCEAVAPGFYTCSSIGLCVYK